MIRTGRQTRIDRLFKQKKQMSAKSDIKLKQYEQNIVLMVLIW